MDFRNMLSETNKCGFGLAQDCASTPRPMTTEELEKFQAEQEERNKQRREQETAGLAAIIALRLFIRDLSDKDSKPDSVDSVWERCCATAEAFRSKAMTLNIDTYRLAELLKP